MSGLKNKQQVTINKMQNLKFDNTSADLKHLIDPRWDSNP